ncbi:serine/threonine-protein kinase [Pseudanabaena galeata UHCC 0370]|uniref:Serine/threonine-protein kinase n=1 Tax=Pseudanabaena galeata UHCC 0370 TaxID=3110310 RepID=A0ABU5TNN0_9CYAN|nr:serine/threonine-protein kinase [Pseudanabaena galeata]MEA5479948.1 serine/threonine-protein kinase [Pseudanabaena galeata UHCC 0370]
MQPDENFWKKCEGEQIANAYELERLLGCGAFGGVFQAVQIASGRRLNKRVALKLMLSGTIQLEELNFALDLPSHQNLVQHFTGNNVEIRGFPMFYLVMELADCSLADFVKKRGGRISSVEAKPIVRDIAQGLKFLHELNSDNSEDKRYVHRDLKLLNILQVGGIWKIADFGLSKALDRGTMQASKIAGTPHYMPPELFRNGYVSTNWDLWSLGVMIVEMLTGHFPFEATYQDELERKIQRENPNLQGVPDEWLTIVKGCLVEDHGRRWSATDVLTAIEFMGAALSQNQSSTIITPSTSSQKPETNDVLPTEIINVPPTEVTNVIPIPIIDVSPIESTDVIPTQTTDVSQTEIINVPPTESTDVIPTQTNDVRPTQTVNVSHSNPNRLWGIAIIIGIMSGVGFLISQSTRHVTSPSSMSSPSSSPTSKATESGKTATDFLNDGQKKHRENNWKESIADYNEAIRLNPNYVLAYARRGLAFKLLNEKDSADRDFKTAINLQVKTAEDYRGRGIAKYGLEDKQGAITDYNEAIRLNPDDADAYYIRGNAKYALGDKQGAITDYNEAIRINPNLALAYNNRGNAKYDLGDKQGAIADFRKAAEFHQQQGNTEFYNQSRDQIRKLGG